MKAGPLFQDQANNDELNKCIALFENVKALIIYAEEISVETNPQILLELRNSLDHLFRALAAEMQKSNDSTYIGKNLDKTYSHLLRTAYDVLDWIGVVLREDITEELRNFCPDTIMKVIPDYYNNIKPRMMDLSEQIGKIRDNKDVAIDNDEAFNEYLVFLKEFQKYRKQISLAIPSMVEIEKYRKKSDNRLWTYTAIVGIVSAVVGALAGYLLSKF